VKVLELKINKKKGGCLEGIFNHFGAFTFKFTFKQRVTRILKFINIYMLQYKFYRLSNNINISMVFPVRK
jgi:hypothetical protein